MALLQMQRINIYALRKDRKPLLELLQRRGVVEISNAIPEDNLFQKSDFTNAKIGFEKCVNVTKEAVAILDHFVPYSKSMLSMLNGRKVVTTREYDDFRNKYATTLKTANLINSLNKEIAEYKSEIQRLEVQTEILMPWTALDIPLSFSETKYTKSYIGSIPKAISLEDLYKKLSDYNLLYIDIISTSKDQTCIFVLCTKSKAEGVYEALRALDFSYPGFIAGKAPAQQLEELKQQISKANEEIGLAEKKIIDLAETREDLLFLQDYDQMRYDKYEVIEQSIQSKNVFILFGYIAQRDAKFLEEELTKLFNVAVELEDPSEEEEVPVKLKNNGFAQPLEWVVEGFSLPGKGEIDPTMAMALFYYMLFGIMFADVGYGAIMVFACAYCLMKGKNKIEAFPANFLKMFLYCGISCIFWGALFGSYFGDLFDVIAINFFDSTKAPVIPALWFFPMNEPMLMLTFSFALGIIQLLAGLIIKAYQLFRQKDYIAILYDAVSWMVLVISSTLLLLSMDMIKTILGISLVIPTILVKISEAAAIVACIVIVLTNGRESRNPIKRFLKGAYALYGISGYLSDVLSYSRLLALGLASGVICSVVNKMAAMTGNSLLGKLAFILIILAGHVINFAINILGAYVHTNRLQYVEFFGKFYGGGGRAFNPFNMKTKYYKVKESTENEY